VSKILKRRIVVSGVNLIELGPLSVFRDALASLAAEHSDEVEIIALVHQASLFEIPGIEYREYPHIKSSWLKRMRFEYLDCRRISEEINPYLWLSMHDMTPSVKAEIRAVYCHNPSPFYPFRIQDLLLSWKFGLFTLFYGFLYGINIKANDFVVVQQDWMRARFRTRYGVNNMVVAHPSINLSVFSAKPPPKNDSRTFYRFFYPAFPRPFKNMELVLHAARRLERAGFNQFEVWLTMDGSESKYAARIKQEFAELTTVKWLGVLPRERIMDLYVESDCLIFPSKLETWGMPITEAKAAGKPILAVDLPYAHETVGSYDKVAFFALDDVTQLATRMRQASIGDQVFGETEEIIPAQPFSKSWSGLWKILLSTKTKS
jgi:glycosyltransferase involved in cell wall biosynthesis